MAMGMLLVSHVPAIASGLETLIKQVAKGFRVARLLRPRQCQNEFGYCRRGQRQTDARL